MGLSGRKEKQRIAADPRNLSWADDASKFGQTYLQSFGWNASEGLGATGDGRKTHISVAQKLDMLGIGAGKSGKDEKDGIAWKQSRDFEMVLARLNGGETSTKAKIEGFASATATASEEPPAKKQKTEPVRRPVGHRAHRARAIASKKMASSSSAAMSEILGIAASTPSTNAQDEDAKLTVIEESPTMEKITTSTLSVADYFKAKMAGAKHSTRNLTEDLDEEPAASFAGIGARRKESDEDSVVTAPSKFAFIFATAPEKSTEDTNDDDTASSSKKKKKKRKDEQDQELDEDTSAASEKAARKAARKAAKAAAAATDTTEPQSDKKKKKRKLKETSQDAL